MVDLERYSYPGSIFYMYGIFTHMCHKNQPFIVDKIYQPYMHPSLVHIGKYIYEKKCNIRKQEKKTLNNRVAMCFLMQQKHIIKSKCRWIFLFLKAPSGDVMFKKKLQRPFSGGDNICLGKLF